MAIKKTGDWGIARNATNAQKLAVNIKKQFSRAVLINGEILRGAVIKGIRHNEFGLAADSDVTTTIKRSSVPLADHGDLTASVQVVPVGFDHVFVGIPRSAKKRGKDMYNIGLIMHEGSLKGTDLSAYPKVRQAIQYKYTKGQKGKKANKQTLGSKPGLKKGFVFIPPRPFFPPAVEKAIPFFSVTYVEAARKVWKEQMKGV